MKQNKQSGFTLIELLVVVLIIGILTAVALPQYTTAVEKSRSTEALTLMSAIAGAAERYRLQKDEWPASNAFNVLDIEVPTVPGSASAYGGRNFTMTMGAPNGATTGDTFVVVAERSLNNANSKYVLKTTITEQSNGTFITVRSCGNDTTTASTNPAPGSTTEAYKFCAAVTNGNMSDF